jgi:putative thioredoxin
VGAQAESEVRAFLKRVAPGEEDELMEQVQALLHDLDWSEAEEMLRDAPSTPAVALARVRALLGQGQGCEAKHLLQDIEEPALYAESQRLLPLAEYLCQFHEDTVEGDEAPIEAQYRHAAMLIRRHNIEAALDGLLEVLRQDKQYAAGQARAVILGLFALLGDDNPLTRRYRSELAMILF